MSSTAKQGYAESLQAVETWQRQLHETDAYAMIQSLRDVLTDKLRAIRERRGEEDDEA